jgi:hypothetical protein
MMTRRTEGQVGWSTAAVVGTLLLGPALAVPAEAPWNDQTLTSPVLAVLKGTLALQAQTQCFDDRRIRVAPTLFQDDQGDRSLGLRASAGVCRLEHDTRADFSQTSYLEGGLDVAVPVSELRIPQNMTGGLGAGLSISLARRAGLDLDADPDDPDAGFYDFNYGFLGLGVRLGYESNAVWDEHGLKAGAQVRWTDPVRSYLPSTVVTLEGVRPVRSEIREALEVDRELYARLGLTGYWRLHVTGPLELGLDAGHFRSWGLDPLLDQAGLDSGSYLAGEVGWRIARPMGGLSLDALFLGYAWGQQPTGVDETRAWTLGVEVGIP